MLKPGVYELIGSLLWAVFLGASLRVVHASDHPSVVPVHPSYFGLKMEAGPLSPGDARSILTEDERGDEVVARVHVQVGENRVVLLPDGQLVVRGPDQGKPAETPFVPYQADQLVARLKQSSFAGWQTDLTRHYVFLYQENGAFLQVTRRILESMLRGITAYTGARNLDVHPPEVPLVVIIFPTREQFQAYHPTPDGVLAYYDVISNHILLCQESPWWPENPELALRQSIATIAHEGAHQILHNIGVQQRLSLWPEWMNEGLAEFFAPTSTDHRLRWKGAGEVNDLRMFELEQLIKVQTGDAIDGQVLAQTVSAARLTSTGYATAWALTHYLAQHRRDDFRAYLRQLTRLGPLERGGEAVPPGVIPSNLRDFKGHFGTDLADLERRLMRHLRQLPYQDPFADWPHVVAFVALPGSPSRTAEVFHDPDQADRWRRDRLEAIPAEYRPAARSGVREFPNRLQAEQFKSQWLFGP